MRHILSLIAVCCSILALSPVARADDQQVDNPLFQIWSKYNVGSSETFDTNINTGSMQMQFEAQHVLAEKAADHVTVTITQTMQMMGQAHTTTRSQTYQAKIDAGNAQQVGEEKVDAAGKTWDCKVWELKSVEKQGDTVKVWSNDQVPGGMIKMEATLPQGTVQSLLKSYEIK